MFDSEKHHRDSIRLPHYDYAQAGGYFVTICAFKRLPFLGEIIDAEVRLNEIGDMVYSIWCEMHQFYGRVGLDVYTIMPNHIHGIIMLYPSVGAGPRACPDEDPTGQPRRVAPTLTLPDVVHRFKSQTTHHFQKDFSLEKRRELDGTLGGKLWQRNYYEHIIRDEEELDRIRQYIIENPLKWEIDHENPISPNFDVEYNEVDLFSPIRGCSVMFHN